ncbi:MULTISPECIES: MFS transporter [unclassified Paenibacillus]|uniref:MFS transporter n=1 Tax=unclassified Paenibacillus TaxID=185978 RepID=UPI0024072BD8|nr:MULTISPECIES: MFS transporter [unclassified Paenibacillus]MDF9839818.1 DHA3 family macrolide efflux protein-like MFS transporter [Paenibacillus sp. PastF-2]MDF9846399.1 DHA3 family macrolide efflux protein-like MFS transporter [Paenibacillus sp. PastM-2]MDF9853252.1 DHA3 family macrolide efflux protein-like MFS transporter [Paenibacillus sp. PastF-1]MDH6478244.1 DHA3 family macrolide efflux protein-like MFS transporter [Paenibacillus sp. PastH-2]MDH6506257.1 DHA3 family macrolide efflux pro
MHWKRTFAFIFSGQIFSILTSSMVQFSIIWHLTETTGSASVLMIAGLVGFLPQAILGPFIGVWLDRWNRKLTMIISDSMIAVTSLILGAYYLWGDPSLWVVYVVLFIRSVASSFHAPSFQAAVPLIAPEDQLTRVAGWQQMVFSASSILGPALGIAVYSATSLGTVLLLDVAGALIANVMLLMVKIHQPKPEVVQAPSFRQEFILGWRTFVSAKPIVFITIAMAGFSVVFMPLAMLFPLMTLEHFGRGGYSASVIEAVFGFGMIAGGVLLSVLSSKWRDSTYMSVSLVIIGLTCLLSGVVGSGAFVAFAVLSFFMGAAAPLFNGPYMAMIQKAYEPETLGRVISLVSSIGMLSSPIGLALAGPVADRYGVQVWFFWSGIVVALIGIIVFLKFYGKAEEEQVQG